MSIAFVFSEEESAHLAYLRNQLWDVAQSMPLGEVALSILPEIYVAFLSGADRIMLSDLDRMIRESGALSEEDLANFDLSKVVLAMSPLVSSSCAVLNVSGFFSDGTLVDDDTLSRALKTGARSDEIYLGVIPMPAFFPESVRKVQDNSVQSNLGEPD